MKFADHEIGALDLTQPRGLVRLVVQYFCAKPAPDLNGNAPLVQHFLDHVRGSGLNYEQLNELLLLLGQNRISKAFFKFFFAPTKLTDDAQLTEPALTLDDLQEGIIRFRALAMLRFGNFIFARRLLSRMESETAIVTALGPYAYEHETTLSSLQMRPEKILDITPIDRDCTWLTGQLSARIIDRELEVAKSDLQSEPDCKRVDWLRDFIQRLQELKNKQAEVERVAVSNVGVYLTWDYLDVYVATSMRSSWEFEETYDFIKAVLTKSRALQGLNLRFFDPTQCKCPNSRDKGLLEGLMLNRSSCTIYMAQEGDTLGKDSELAVTLAQGKPVIAYVPDLEPAEYASKIKNRPLDFFEKRLKILDAEGILDDPDSIARFARIDPDSDRTIRAFSDRLQEFREENKFSLARELEENFKAWPSFLNICRLVAEAEVVNFNKRAFLLRGAHPLSMQIDMRTGTANGVIVVRSRAACAQVLYDLLTNDLDLEIVRERKDNEDFTLLTERTSGSPFRAVTHNDQLTNSFWNLFK